MVLHGDRAKHPGPTAGHEDFSVGMVVAPPGEVEGADFAWAAAVVTSQGCLAGLEERSGRTRLAEEGKLVLPPCGSFPGRAG